MQSLTVTLRLPTRVKLWSLHNIPTRIMNSAQIHFVLSKDSCTKYTFRGVFPSDKLKHVGKGDDDGVHIQKKQAKKRKRLDLPAAYVANTDPASKPGTHWVAFYFPAETDGPAEYFDSYGKQPTKGAFQGFLRLYGHRSPAVYNGQEIQGQLTTTCGQYSILFILLRCRGFNINEITGMFSKDEKRWNDSMVTAFVNKHFDIQTETIDYDYVLQYAGLKTH